MSYHLFKTIGLLVLLSTSLSLFTIYTGNAQPNGESEEQTKSLYQQGVQAYENGHTHQALKLWFDGYLAARKAGRSNPRLSIAFLEAVIADSIVKHYDTASRLYRWGMQTQNIDTYNDVLRQEVGRLEILLQAKQYNRLSRKFRRENPDAMNQILAFWDQLDPSPSTPINERLLEHWQRINYAQKNWPGHHPYYNTDDRGLTYIQYGRPDRVKRGTIRSLQFRPGYEIWIYYKNLSENSYLHFDNLVVIFGDKGDGAGFGRIESLADFLDTTAINNSRGQAQIAVLRELTHIDAFFNETLADIESRLATSEVITNSFGRVLQYEIEEALARLEIIAGKKTTSLPPIEIDVANYRFLDLKNQPYIISVISSFPQMLLLSNLSNLADSTKYEYRHVYQLQDPQKNVISSSVTIPSIPIKAFEGNTFLPAQTQYRVAHQPESFSQIYAGEYYSEPLSKENRSGLASQLAGAGKISPSQPDPLPVNKSQLVLSDLVVGYNDEERTGGYFPFNVAYQNKIPRGKDLMFHFEVYHLQPVAEDIAEFQVIYKLKKDDNFLGSLFSGNDGQGQLTLNFETRDTLFAENISVETSGLEPGSYELNIRIKELSSDRNIERKLEFEIIE